MNIFALIFLALAMSADAFTAALAKGMTMKDAKFVVALRSGLVFGVVESITPVVGYFLGKVASDFVEGIDHWIAFILLGALGLKLIYDAMFGKDDVEEDTPQTNNLFLLIVTALATSIDAMAVGVSLAFLSVNIWLAAALIGLATTIMATLGIYLGNKLNTKVGKIAEIIGGTALIAIGLFILIGHLTHAVS